MEKQLDERLLEAWVGLNSALKDSAMTSGLTYNEAIVMRIAYDKYRDDGVGSIPMQDIIRETNMLKSLANRTVDALCGKGLLTKEQDERDRRSITLRVNPDNIDVFERVHAQSLEKANLILQAIGLDDAEAFIRCYEKVRASGISFS